MSTSQHVDISYVVKDRAGRVMVNPDLSVPGAPDVIVIGDLVASILKSDGKPVPGLAPAL